MIKNKNVIDLNKGTKMCDLDEIFKEAVKGVTNKELNEYSGAAKIGNNPIKCDDQFAAIIEVTKLKISFLFNDITATERISKQKFYEEKKLDVVALGPAMGNTGCNIESMLLGNLMKYCLMNDMQKEGAYSKSSSKIQEGKYKLLLINACQYQCSLGNLRSDDNKKRRDDIFKKVFQNEPIIKDFIKRVELYRPKIIINCCTHGKKHDLHKQVQEVIDKNFMYATKLVGDHPTSAFFARGFQDS